MEKEAAPAAAPRAGCPHAAVRFEAGWEKAGQECVPVARRVCLHCGRAWTAPRLALPGEVPPEEGFLVKR